MSIIQFVLTYDFKKPQKQIICDLIYVANQYKLPPTMVEFGAAMQLDQRPDLEDDPNSYIEADVNPNFDHRLVSGETGFLYHRLPLASLRVVDNSIIQPLAIPFKTYDILDQINTQLGTQLTEDDLENIEYVTMDDDFIIVAKPTSKLWTGWRHINVLGGGKKYMLFPNYMLSGFTSAPEIEYDHRAQLTRIANRENVTSWVEGRDFDFGAMEVINTTPAGHNARVYLHSNKDGFVDQWIFIRRISPNTINNQFVGQEVPLVPVPDEIFTLHQILPLINQTLNLQLTGADIENKAYQPDTTECELVFKKNSLAWLPGTYLLKTKPEEVIVPNVRMTGDGNHRRVNADDYRFYQHPQ